MGLKINGYFFAVIQVCLHSHSLIFNFAFCAWEVCIYILKCAAFFYAQNWLPLTYCSNYRTLLSLIGQPDWNLLHFTELSVWVWVITLLTRILLKPDERVVRVAFQETLKVPSILRVASVELKQFHWKFLSTSAACFSLLEHEI